MARLTEANVNQQPARIPARPAVARRIPEIFERVARYVREVIAELKRVDWPSRPEAVASTIVVVAVLLLMAAYLGLWDFLFSLFFTRVLAR